MLSRKQRQAIDSLAWDCTVGSGEALEKPQQRHWKRLAELLPEVPLAEAVPAFLSAWQRSLQEMEQP